MSKAERTRQMIIEQAAPIFNEKGIAGTSIDDVLKAAGVAKGCLYGHFDSKEELSYATVDYMLQKIIDRRNRVIEKETTAKAKLFAFMDLHKDPLNSLITGGCPILNFSIESDNTNPVVQQKIQTIIISGNKLFASIIKEGIKNGEFKADLNADEFALKMFAAIEGGNFISKAMNNSKYNLTIIKNLKKEIETYCIT